MSTAAGCLGMLANCALICVTVKPRWVAARQTPLPIVFHLAPRYTARAIGSWQRQLYAIWHVNRPISSLSTSC